jgi:hypothetical protein
MRTLLALVCLIPAFGQIYSGLSPESALSTIDYSTGRLKPPKTTYAALPAATSSVDLVYLVTDGNSTCTGGGGTKQCWFRSNGTAWVTVGDGGSSTGAAPPGTDCDLSTQKVVYDITTNAYSCATDQTSAGASLENFVRPEDHGANGTDLVDDTTAFNSAIAAAAASGKRVLGRCGSTYLITPSINVTTANIVIEAETMGCATIKKNGNGTIFNFRANGIIFRNWRIDGNTASFNNHCLVIENAADGVRVEYNIVSNCRDSNILAYNNTNASISYNESYGGTTGIKIENNSKYTRIQHNRVQGFNFIGIMGHSTVEGADVDGAQVNDNFINISDTDAVFGMEFGSFTTLNAIGDRPSGITVTGNVMIATVTPTPAVTGGYSFDSLRSITITGNTFTTNGNGVDMGFEITNCENATVTANVFVFDGGGVAISLDRGSQNHVVANNIIIGMGSSGNQGRGIMLQDSDTGKTSRNVQIVNNYLELTNNGTTNAEVIKIGCNDATGTFVDYVVSGNVIYGSGAISSSSDGIRVAEDNAGCAMSGGIVRDNFIRGMDAGITTAGDVGGLIMQDNRFAGNNSNYGLAGTNHGKLMNETLGTQTVASAATMTLPTGGSTFNITGTTAITTLNSCDGTRDGDIVTLIFASTASLTDGNNLKLSANFTGGADRSISLRCSSGNWYEVGKSTN